MAVLVASVQRQGMMQEELEDESGSVESGEEEECVSVIGAAIVRHFGRLQIGCGKRNPMPVEVRLLCMKMITMHGVSIRDASSLYALMLDALPGAEHLGVDARLPPTYFQRKLEQARCACVVSNAVDLARAIGHRAVMGDGGSDHVLKQGIMEFFCYLEQITTAEGELKTVYGDGFLVSGGLTSEEEVTVCMDLKDMLRYVLTMAKQIMRRRYPLQYKEAKYLGASCDPSHISMVMKRYFLADGAAQKWARLMQTEKAKAVAENFSEEQLLKLDPWERRHLEWSETGNCNMHNLSLGAQHADKGSRAITDEVTEYARERVEQLGEVHECSSSSSSSISSSSSSSSSPSHQYVMSTVLFRGRHTP
jgi:hypothetical protein